MNYKSVIDGAADRSLPDFVYKFLNCYGAAVERRKGGLEALLPERLQTRLGASEHIVVATDADFYSGEKSENLEEPVFTINYGSELLDKMVDTVCTEVPLLACRLAFNYIKSQGFDALVEDSIKFPGAVGKVESWAAVNTDYVFLTCKYRVQSDEQKDGLFSLVFNLDTGASVPGMTEGIDFGEKTYSEPGHASVRNQTRIRDIMACIGKASETAVEQEVGSFRESMNRRFRRDVENLEEYYAGLKEEMKKSLRRTGLSEQLVQDRKEKIAQIPEELARKREDLFKKYSIRIKIRPCRVMMVTSPAVKILYTASVGKKEKNLSLVYNPATKTVDPFVCEGCRGTMTRVHFCDRLHVLCPGCARSCPVCS